MDVDAVKRPRKETNDDGLYSVLATADQRDRSKPLHRRNSPGATGLPEQPRVAAAPQTRTGVRTRATVSAYRGSQHESDEGGKTPMGMGPNRVTGAWRDSVS